MGYRKIAKKIVEQGDCGGIGCNECPLHQDTNPAWAQHRCETYDINGGTGNDTDCRHNRVCYAKQYLAEHPKKEKKAAKEATDPRIGTIWEWTGSDGKVWERGDRAKLISIVSNGEGVFEGRNKTWALNTSFLVQVDDTKKEETVVEFVPGRAYIGELGTIVLCFNSEGKSHTNFSGIPIGGTMLAYYDNPDYWIAWCKDAFKPCKIEVKVIE